MQVDWSEAPEWANWAAMDADGYCYWFELTPHIGDNAWNSATGKVSPFSSESFGHSDNSDGWEKSLTSRPDDMLIAKEEVVFSDNHVEQHRQLNSDESTRASILDEAMGIVTQDRNNRYGEPEDAFSDIAELWSVYLDHHVGSHDVAVMMTLLKVARIKANPSKRDSWVDAAGYIACGAECVDLE